MLSLALDINNKYFCFFTFYLYTKSHLSVKKSIDCYSSINNTLNGTKHFDVVCRIII